MGLAGPAGTKAKNKMQERVSRLAASRAAHRQVTAILRQWAERREDNDADVHRLGSLSGSIRLKGRRTANRKAEAAVVR
jgi:hypothetical protein